MSDLYEQKYLKYRGKYIELKNQLNGGSSQNTLTKYDSNNSGLRDFLIKYGGAAAVPADPAVPAVEIITIKLTKDKPQFLKVTRNDVYPRKYETIRGKEVVFNYPSGYKKKVYLTYEDYEYDHSSKVYDSQGNNIDENKRYFKVKKEGLEINFKDLPLGPQDDDLFKSKNKYYNYKGLTLELYPSIREASNNLGVAFMKFNENAKNKNLNNQNLTELQAAIELANVYSIETKEAAFVLDEGSKILVEDEELNIKLKDKKEVIQKAIDNNDIESLNNKIDELNEMIPIVKVKKTIDKALQLKEEAAKAKKEVLLKGLQEAIESNNIDKLTEAIDSATNHNREINDPNVQEKIMEAENTKAKAEANAKVAADAEAAANALRLEQEAKKAEADAKAAAAKAEAEALEKLKNFKFFKYPQFAESSRLHSKNPHFGKIEKRDENYVLKVIDGSGKSTTEDGFFKFKNLGIVISDDYKWRKIGNKETIARFFYIEYKPENNEIIKSLFDLSELNLYLNMSD